MIPLQKASQCLECEQSRLRDVIPNIQVLLRIYQMLIYISKISFLSSLNILHELIEQVFVEYMKLKILKIQNLH